METLGKALLVFGGTTATLAIVAWIGAGWGTTNPVTAGFAIAVGLCCGGLGGLLIVAAVR